MERNMKKLIKIYGMNCLQCAIKVNDALNAIPGVQAEIDHDKQIALVSANKSITDKQILQAIKACGYDGVIL
jgi:copper chaperone CopZ